MRTYLFILIISLTSLSLYSQDDIPKRPRHMVMITTQGFGYGGAVEKAETSNSSPFKNVTINRNNFSLNYAYTLTDRIQLGAFYKQSHYDGNLTSKDGKKADIDQMSNSFGVFTLYNFNDDLFSSFYVGFLVANINVEEEYGHGFTEAEGKAPFELDEDGTLYQIYFGKRFSLKRFGIQNITYSPQIAMYSRTYGKDYGDQGFDKGKGLVVDVLRFDVLF
jgi:hypothetical protein